MRIIRPNALRLRLDPVSDESLRQQILRRDNWRCQSGGVMLNLEIHHKEFRSHSGSDSEENLITLCTGCHASVHQHRSHNSTEKKEGERVKSTRPNSTKYSDE